MKVLAEACECKCMQHSYVYATEDSLLLGYRKWRTQVPLKHRCISVTPNLRIKQSEIVLHFDDV